MGKDPEHPTKSDNDDNNGVPMEQDEPNEIAGMTVKLQPFWPDSPENWFLLAEIQFEMQKVKAEGQRYLQTLAAIPSTIHDKISDLLRAPPTKDQYTILKHTLLNRLSPSDERQLEKLLSGQEIGDRSPSEVLRHIRELARDNFPDKIVRSLWSRKMPEIIRIAVAAQPDTTSTNALAEVADRMYEAMSASQHQQLAPITRQSRPQFKNSPSFGRGEHRQPTTSKNTLEDRIIRIESRLDRMARSSQSRDRSSSSSRRFPSQQRFRNRSRSRGVSRNNNNQRGSCWYHQTFGANARKCHKPCSFGPSTSAMDLDSESKNL